MPLTALLQFLRERSHVGGHLLQIVTMSGKMVPIYPDQLMEDRCIARFQPSQVGTMFSKRENERLSHTEPPIRP